MRLTRFTDNALRCLIFLGSAPTRSATVAEISGQMAMSDDHLTKVVQRLARKGYVSTLRGRGGGVRLEREPGTIVVGEVIRDCEDDLALVPCFACSESCPISPVCRLAGLLDDALGAFLKLLDQATLADLIGDRDALVRIMRAASNGRGP
jgi:Rrf2 family nitric oxide-sensitive transcriptional repressor